MLTVIPVFHSQNDPVWASPEGATLLERFLSRFSGPDCAVVTVSPDVVRLAVGLGLEAVLVDPPDSSYEPLMPGMATAVNSLAPIDPGETFVFLDHRNPLLELDDVDGAVRLFHSGAGRMVFTAFVPRDHPCQFTRYSRVISLGLIHLLDGERPGCRPVSKPFPCDWLGLPVDDPEAMRYRFAQGPEGPTLRSVWSTDGPEWSILREENTSARLEMPIPASSAAPSGYSLVGMSWSVSAGLTRPFLYKKAVSGQLLLDTGLAESPIESVRAVLIPFMESGACPSEGIALRIDTATGTVAFDCSIPALGGFVYAFLGDAEGHYSDMVEPFEPDCGLWRVEKPSLERINSQTGKPILGRQDFPEVLAFDGSVLVISGQALCSMKNPEDLMSEAVPHLLAQSRQIIVDSPFKLLALKARREAMANV